MRDVGKESGKKAPEQLFHNIPQLGTQSMGAETS